MERHFVFRGTTQPTKAVRHEVLHLELYELLKDLFLEVDFTVASTHQILNDSLEIWGDAYIDGNYHPAIAKIDLRSPHKSSFTIRKCF